LLEIRVESAPSLRELRRRLASIRGLTAASWSPPSSQGRLEEARIVPAELIEKPLLARAVGAAEAWPDPVAFLDGVERSEVVAYAGAAPLLMAEIAAAVRERKDRQARTVIVERRRLAVGRPEVLEHAAAALEGMTTIALETSEPAHPLRDVDLARAQVDRARGELERRVGDAYRRRCDGWLVVDGSLAESPSWAADTHMIGVAKSHATLPFEGNELVTYLELPVGSRSSVFQPGSRQRAPVYAWGLRLWDWTGKDLLYGLVRLEAAARAETLALVDQLSRWVMAERAPISADARWDRLLYGVHSVEQFLKASRV